MLEIIGFILLGLISGIAAATLGIGGGVIFVPALVVLFSFDQHIAQGTSLAIILPTAIVGTYIHARRGRVEWRTAGLVALGGFIGGLGGAQLALALDAAILRRLFAGLLVVIAYRMISK